MSYEEFIEVMMTNLGKIDKYNKEKARIGWAVTTNELVWLALR